MSQPTPGVQSAARLDGTGGGGYKQRMATGHEAAGAEAPTIADGGYAGRRIEDLPQLWDGFAKLVREGLGISGFGVQIMDLPPDYRTKSHDEARSGQQELYLALRGSGTVLIHSEPEDNVTLDTDHVVAVSPEVERTLTSGSEGMRVLCIGGAPGRAYSPPEWTTG